jgi:hypothetical protein
MVQASPVLPYHLINGPVYRTWCGMLLDHGTAGPAAPKGVILLEPQVRRLGARICVPCQSAWETERGPWQHAA